MVDYIGYVCIARWSLFRLFPSSTIKPSSSERYV